MVALSMPRLYLDGYLDADVDDLDATKDAYDCFWDFLYDMGWHHALEGREMLDCPHDDMMCGLNAEFQEAYYLGYEDCTTGLNGGV